MVQSGLDRVHFSDIGKCTNGSLRHNKREQATFLSLSPLRFYIYNPPI